VEDAVTEPASGRPRRYGFLATGWLCLLLAAGAPIPGEAQAPEPSSGSRRAQKHVVLLYSESRLLPAVAAIDDALRGALEAGSPDDLYFYVEHLDLSLFDHGVPQRELRDLLRRKYRGRRIDLILAVDSRTLRIALQNRALLFSGAPIVFAAVDHTAAADLRLDQDITGTWLTPGWDATLEAALRLQPGTRQALVITGTGSRDRVWLASARRQLAPLEGRVEVRYMSDATLDDVLKAVSSLPSSSVVLAGPFQRDPTGRSFIARDATSRIAAAASVPVYGLFDTHLDTGIVGGELVNFEAHGRVAADLALRTLKGERPPPTDSGTTVPMFDWRQLQRWGLDEGRLPAGSVVLYREPSTWDRYQWWIVGAVVIFLLQSALIAALLVNRALRRRTRRALAGRLRFETLLSDLSVMFAAGTPSTVDRDIEAGLRRIVEDLDLDRATLVMLQPSSDEVRVTHSWARQGVTSLREMIPGTEAPWIVGQLRAGHIVRLGQPDDLPADATVDRQALERFGTRSGAVVPLVERGVTFGGLAVATVRQPRVWPEELLPRLRLLADVFTRALERREAQRAVRESEERFRRMADSAPMMVWLAGPEGRRSYVNQRWLDFTGRPLDEELGDQWVARVHPEDREELARTLSAALAEGRPFTAEYRLARRGQQYRWLLDHGAPRRGDDGRLLGYVGSAVDVTQLRAAQQALLETDLLRSAIFGSLYGHVAALDKHGRIIAVNQAWLRFAAANGGDPGRVSIGASYLDVCRSAAEAGDPDAGRILDAVVSVLAGGTPCQIEYAWQTPGGERWYEMTAEPLRRPEGGALVTHVDVTRRRQAEEEAQRQRDELAHVLRTTTLGELAASLAHEINQPLAAIVANAQAMRRLLDAGRASRPGVTETLGDIVDDAKRASQVIRRLRALFRKEHVESRSVDVNEVVEDAVGVVRHDAGRRRIAMRCALAPKLDPVRGDAVQLQQVLLNVLVNACEAIAATDDGPRDVLVETTALESSGVAISIRDTGIGVKDADLKRIFEHFVSSKAEGLGMGLAISRSIVEAHGGRIWATSNPDRGLTLRVELPSSRESGQP
jgi:PAS domain S-box-containing protein